MGVPSPRAATLAVLAGALLLAAAPTALPAAGGEGDFAGPEWNQWGGNASRTFAADVEPVVTLPREVRRIRLPGRLLAEPVFSGGAVYAVCARREDAVLYAWNLADGASRGSRSQGKEDIVSGLAVWQGNVVVADSLGIRGHRHREGFFTVAWEEKGLQGAAPALHDGVVYAETGGTVHPLDATNGKPRAWGSVSSHAPPVLYPDRGGRLGVAGAWAREPARGYFQVHLERIDVPVRDLAVSRENPKYGLRLFRIPPGDGAPGGFFVVSGAPFLGKTAEGKDVLCPSFAVQDEGKGGGLCTMKSEPTCFRGHAYGFDPSGDLIGIRSEGPFVRVVESRSLPPGAVPGQASRARGVAYFGNWAVDLPSKRVLWCLPSLKPASRAYPVADRTLAVIEGEDVVILTDAPSGAPASSPPSATAAAPAAAPTGKDGLLLVDGREIEGKVDLFGSAGVKVFPASGAPLEIPDAEIAMVFRDGKVLMTRNEEAVLALWRRHLRPPVAAALEEHYGVLAKDHLLRECRRVLEEAREWGVAEERAAEMERMVAGRQEPTQADGIARKRTREFEPRRKALRGRVLEGAAWCRERGLGIATAVLLGDAERIHPDREETERRAREALPAGLPRAAAADAGARWIRWAGELARVKGRLVPPGDPARARAKRGPWQDEEAVIVVRTPHLLLWSRSEDPEIVGRCLRNGEWTVRVLEELLGTDAVEPVAGEEDLLDVRLHRSRPEFLSERTPSGGYPMPWSAGYYNRVEGVSRFYVPEPGEGDPLGRGLFSVLAHELTHHFLERRWKEGRARGSAGPDDHGYWCVEGIARFVEDQVVEMDRRGLRFDDRTVPSLDSTAQAKGRGVLFPPHLLADLSQRGFHGLPDEGVLEVRLRNTLQVRVLSPLSLFYEQAGSTAFFLLNERGPEGRAAFFRYLAAYYRGRDPGPAWQELGFRDAADFDWLFEKFLEGLR